MINSIENKNFKYSKINDPFNYILMENFLNLDYLKKIDNYFDKVPDTLYVNESVPQSVMNKLDFYNLKEDDQLEVNCVSDFSSENKSVNNPKIKKIDFKINPNGQQGINRLFVDINNIDLFPEILPLKNKLVSKSFNQLLGKELKCDLDKTRLKIELLRNKKGHFLFPHQDCVEKIVSFLIYINFNNQPIDAGTDIYSIKNEEYQKETMKRNFDDFNKLKTVPFINNSCFVFGQTKDSWHGLDPGKNFSERRVIQLNWVNEEFSSYNDCFPLEV